ncbi:hypothetical protein [Nonomuraea sp. C10]|uniref:hypothetical protein n=1 Tax=Nonomuraea sp. C10 TaxID=2600577 RepID=UPI0011CE8CCC|nr:hypothetical protein [Nonomuraea sp. C10]TXK41459.1 hypothetical protein FR742_19480 [Nonomuraea sp. C10]
MIVQDHRHPAWEQQASLARRRSIVRTVPSSPTALACCRSAELRRDGSNSSRGTVSVGASGGRPVSTSTMVRRQRSASARTSAPAPMTAKSAAAIKCPASTTCSPASDGSRTDVPASPTT